MDPAIEMAYTPEYSDELLGLIVELYKDEVKPQLQDLRLLKMLDLLELAQSDFEQYKESLRQHMHIKCLKTYIVGLFLVFLVIPQSIQFQIKNKNYEVFLALKQLFERETNMANVKLQVVDYIASMNMDVADHTRPHRANTLPVSVMDQDLAQYFKSDTAPTVSSAASVSSMSSGSSVSDGIWSPPDLQPMDHLQLAEDNEFQDSLVPQLPPYPPPTPPSLVHSLSDPIASVNTEQQQQQQQQHTVTQSYDRKVTHRKDSYHSVYAEDAYEDIQVISPKQLYESLHLGLHSVLICDIRPAHSFQTNHIPHSDIINLDPEIVAQSIDYLDLEQHARAVLTVQGFAAFRDINKYDYVVYYSDSRATLISEVDFIEKFSLLLNQRRVYPKLMKGGFESWTKYLSRSNIKSRDINFPLMKPLLHPPRVAPPLPPQHRFPPISHHQPQAAMNSTAPKHVSRSSTQHVAAQVPGPYPTQHYYTTLPFDHPPPPGPRIHHLHQEPLHVQNIKSIPTIQRSHNVFVRLSITGLRNMGNTCYINCMIQCLFGSTHFRDIFLDNRFEEYYNPKFQKPRITPSLSLLFKKMYLNGACSIVPSGFLKSCVQLRPDLKIPTEQQDTHEFLMFLLDQLHDELSNSNAVVNDYPELMQHESLGQEYEKWFDGLIKQGISPVSKYFQGQLQDCVQCQSCGFKSSNYSTFYMLSLVIPKFSSSGKKLRRVTLEDCIQMFTVKELLSGENAWDCPKCSVKSDAPAEKDRSAPRHRFLGSGFKIRGRSSSPAPSKGDPKSSKKAKLSIKSLTFVVLPPILIIHLSRFLFYDTSQKDTAIVTYPLILEIPHNGDMVRYKLFGVVNHNGTLKSGHYTSVANKNLDHDLVNPDWYYFDDEVVKHINHGRVDGGSQTHMSSSEVYVLFYERID